MVLYPIEKNTDMKPLHMLIGCLLFSNTFSQENSDKEISTEVNNVTVFIKGAQVVRKKTVELPQGNTTLKFTDLSPFIDPKSIQVKVKGPVTVLSVNHQQNYLKSLQTSQELEMLERSVEEIDDKLKLENTYLVIIKQELDFLEANKEIGGREKELSIENLKQAAAFYSEKITALRLDEINRNQKVKHLTFEKNLLQQQISTLSSKKEFPSGEILVRFNAKSATTVKIELAYLVENAGWFPSYDIRAKSIDDPVEIVYKANVHQDTKENWTNVKLTFSSSDPNVSGIAPRLKTYYLNYNLMPPTYSMTSNSVRGRVTDYNNQPIPGASVVVRGTTIGAISDVNGNYSITLPYNAGSLVFSLVGYNSKELPINNAVMNVQLEEDIVSLEEVVVAGNGLSKNSDIIGALQGKAAGISTSKSREIKIRGTSSIAVPTEQVTNQTTVEFQIDIPYTINSDNKNYTIEMVAYSLPAYFEYYCVPKINRDAFLMAYIVDWEKYNLLEGEASIFFEDTYVGKSLLDVRYSSDTLNISLGRDKNVVVNREKQKDFMSKQFLGTTREVTKSWLLTIKNNKSQKINIAILDQVPVSLQENIVVETQKLSGGILNTDTGEVKWKLALDPSTRKEIELRYSVKYPKSQYLVVE